VLYKILILPTLCTYVPTQNVMYTKQHILFNVHSLSQWISRVKAEAKLLSLSLLSAERVEYYDDGDVTVRVHRNHDQLLFVLWLRTQKK